MGHALPFPSVSPRLQPPPQRCLVPYIDEIFEDVAGGALHVGRAMERLHEPAHVWQW